MDDTYFKERIADIKDVRKRVLSHLLNIPITDLSNLKEDSIIVAEDLSPSDTASLNLSRTKGFITSVGGRTSHTAIMARSLGIPAVVGVRDIDKKVNDGDLVIMDAISGDVVINPDKLQVKTYQKKIEDLKKLNSKYEPYINAETLSKDGHILEFSANIGSIDDVNQNLSETSDGIGLFRTEFLYMNQDHLPTEEEQYKAYKAVLERMGNKKVIIRTLDIGGDKHLEYLELDEEMNPFLGHRALRLCLSNKDLFKTQLRALLKASVYGNLHIMFPMVATLGELREAKALLEECESELTNENSNFSKDYKIGIMIEIPAAALLADQFAKEVDFFSIGTNDLIQYTFAADRMNQSVSYLYQPYNPSLLRLIKMVIDASHKEGIWTGMCGEMAGDVYALPVLFGLGLDEFSMAASSIKKLRYYLSHLSKEECKAIAEHSLALSSNEEVQEYIIKTIGDIV
jgi:phosphotransferase system enzyme I (PtsI)